ncbi:hypothetical protein FRC02_009806 [Tulasnella sp. 418]|nr:hypothetical protein FRC02_009806 [Tulasnella sp. 418]
MQDARRAEIQAKKAKLEEIRKLRKAREDAKKGSPSGTSSPRPVSRRDVDDLLDDIIGRRADSPKPKVAEGALAADSSTTPGSLSMPSTPPPFGLPLPTLAGRLSAGGGSTSKASDAGSEIAAESTPHQRFIPDLIDVEQELFELPQKQRVIYNKEVQTTEVIVEIKGASEELIRQQIQREQQEAAERAIHEQKELDEENAKLDKEIEEGIRDLTEEERASIFVAPEFLDFIEHSSKIVQRALSDGYDYIKDYTIGMEAGLDDTEGKRMKQVCVFSDPRWTKNRSITDLDWSPKYPELSVASYNKNPAALNDPDGLVAVWNLHLLERAEFVFHSQSDVLSVSFSPFHPNLVFGGTYSGQVLLWDTRSKHLPVLKTPLSAAGHTHPIYSMRMVGTQNAHNLITASTDGVVCSWLVDMLAQPQETLDLVHAGHNKTDEVAITALDFPYNETTTFWVGTEEGNVYQANRYDRAGSKAGLNQHDVYKGHSGPVMGLSFHPLAGPVDFSDLFLTCSVDWTVKLWRSKSIAKPSTSPTVIPPLYSFDEADDYVYDVKWHPHHPAVFGSADGSGKFHLWNLNTDTEVPLVSTPVGSGRALNKLSWDMKDGRRVGIGSSDGHVYVYDIGDVAVPRESEWVDMQKSLAGMITGGTQTSLSVMSDGEPRRM